MFILNLVTKMNTTDTYQYFTEADMSKLRSAGYEKPFTSLEDGVADYVTSHLAPNDTW